MIKELHINQYRKLKDIDFSFSKNINIISGTNGTCKTSLLHIIANSFKQLYKTCDWIKDKKCLEIINQLNTSINPKLETLTRESKHYSDPANNIKGALFTAKYFNHTPLDFRKHNIEEENRYSVKPKYPKGEKQRLPFLPIIYLGIKRLVPYGEFTDDKSVEDIKKNLPDKYLIEISQLYKQCTGIQIQINSHQKMGSIKNRADFDSNYDGVDSNTISAGEDNLYIILTSLVSLKYYYDSTDKSDQISSMLLIDEFDATLHPGLQWRLLNILRDYSDECKIQVIMTSHSLSLLEYAFKNKDNVIYLIDNETDAIKMSEPDIYKIQMYLKEKSRDELFNNNKIPIFSEDNEARFLINIMFDYFSIKYDEFARINNYFYLVEANMGSDNLTSIFMDVNLKMTTGLICILDGDKNDDISNKIITLPGNNSPENFLIEYANSLYAQNNDDFWKKSIILEEALGKRYYTNSFKADAEEIERKLQNLASNKESIHGIERKLNKEFFNKHKKFIKLVFEHWLSDKNNQIEIKSFYKKLNILFKKAAEVNGVNSKLWTVK